MTTQTSQAVAYRIAADHFGLDVEGMARALATTEDDPSALVWGGRYWPTGSESTYSLEKIRSLVTAIVAALNAQRA